jgi:hypothetical protein
VSDTSSPQDEGHDVGAERDTRPHPCAKRTWCVELDGHDGACLEVPREVRSPADYGPTYRKLAGRRDP